MATATVEAVDLYCGAGGTSSGLADACEELDYGLSLIAVNHWDVAIATHTANHPNATHYCQSVDNMNPREVVPGGYLRLLVASPECIFHSNARGGKPINDQRRASAWHILRWAEALYIENIIIENVPEFEMWGPLTKAGTRMQKMKGATFVAFLEALKSLGYHVDYRVLCCADYGDPTTRERLFIIARRKKKVIWPEPTHSKDPQRDMFGKKLKKWVAAKEIIDWTIPGKSIFERNRPLSPNTLKRIEAGLKKFGGAKAEPFLIVLRKNGGARSLDKPLPTITASGKHFGVVDTHDSVPEPFVLGQQSGSVPRSIGDPVPTIATDGAIALVQPFLVGAGGPTGSARPRSTEDPMKTVLCDDRTALVEPFIVPQFGGSTPRSVKRPLGTITTTSRGIGLCEPYIVSVNHGNDGAGDKGHKRRTHDVKEPLPTVTVKNGYGLVEPLIGPPARDRKHYHAVPEESPDPFIAKFFGTGTAVSVEEPLDTVTTKDRFALVEPRGDGYRVDIRFRMLQTHELAAAQSLHGYKFTGNKEDITKQIGNAVPRRTAKALCKAVLS